jgi:hypothetical protein
VAGRVDGGDPAAPGSPPPMRRLEAVSLGIAVAAGLAALPVHWPTWFHVVLLTATLVVGPGWLLAPALVPERGHTHRALLALALSPFLAAAPAAALMWLRVPAAPAARAVFGVVAVVALLRARRGGQPAPAEPEAGACWIPALAWSALVAGLFVANRWLAPRGDGWFHASVALQIGQRGLPPEDPFLAGLGLLYFWGAHVWGALWLGTAPGLSVWTPLVVLNLSGAVAVVLGACLLARRLGAGRRAIWLTSLLTVFGYAPFSWLAVVLRLGLGRVVGSAEARQLLGNGVVPVLAALDPGTLHVSLVFFGDKFLILTPFAAGLGVFAALVIAFLDFVASPDLRRGVTLGLLEAAALFLHSVIGWAAALMAAAWWGWAAARARGPAAAGSRRVLLPLMAVFAAAACSLAPYLAATTLGKQQQLGWGLTMASVKSWLVAGALLVPAGFAWLGSRGPGPARELLGLAAALSLAGLCLRLPFENQVKIFNLLFLVLAAPAALGWLALRDRLPLAGRRALTAAAWLAIAPTAALCLWGFATEAGQTSVNWQRATRAGEAAGLAWIRAHTAPEAVVADRAAGLDLTVHAARSALYGGEDWGSNWGYPDSALALRRRAAIELGSGRPASPQTRSFLRALGREVIVAQRRDSRDWRVRVRDEGEQAYAGSRVSVMHPAAGMPVEPPFPWRPMPAGLRPLYANREIALYRWEDR